MQHLPKYYKWIFFFIVLLVVLSIVTPVLADYLGPDRTVTTYVSYCRYVQKRCAQQKNGQWEWNTVEDWDCSHGDRGCSDGGGACNKDNDGARSCERDEGVRKETVTYPSATIAGSVNCTSYNGWCNGGSVPELALSANEPLAGYNITLIEGTLNGTSFACASGAASCNLPMGEGDNNFHYWALSSWGDSSRMGTSSARVDTVPPEVGLSVTGTTGHNGWYKSVIDVSAIASDATSGVATFEVAADGGRYQGYTPIAFDDGRHTLQFRVVDNAGNVFEAPVQNFNVDTIPPTIDLPAAWRLGRDVEYSVRDEGSGLASVRIVIEDEDEKYAKVTWDRNASGKSYTSHIDWDGLFKDKTAAPPGTYYLWVKAQDNAGNERFQAGKIIVPEPNVPLAALPTADPLATDVALLPPAELVEVDTVPVTAGQSAVEGVVSPSEQTTTQTILLTTGSAGAAASTTTTSGILWGAAAAAAIAAATTYALDVTQKRKQAEEAQAERVRAQVAHDKAEWAEKHLTREEKAQRAEQHDQKVKERKEQQSWANPAKEKALLKEQEERDRAYQEQLQQEKLRQQLANQRVAMKLTKFEVQQEVQRRAEQEALKKQREQAAANARTEKKMAQLETLDAGWVAAQAAAKKKQEEEQESPGKLASLWEKAKSFVKEKIIEPVNEKIIQPYIKPHVENEIEKAKNAISWVDEKVVQPYVKPHVENEIEKAKNAISWVDEKVVQPYVKPYVEKQIEKAKNTIEVVNEKVVQPYIVPAVTAVQEKSWWQKTWEEVKDAREKAILWVDQHQTEIALGIGVAVGIAAIVLSGGTATPLVAAWVAGAAAVAAGAIAIETVALNVHYGREWHENLGRNIAISALSAAAVAGAWFIFQAATTAAGPFCYAHQAICGRIEPVLNTLDWGEEAWLTTKMAFQTWTGNQAAAAETALELQMERMDGGMPGNSIAKELGEETLEKVAKYGDEALSLVMLYGDDAAEIIAKYGDDGVAVLQKYGDDAVDLITRYKDDTFDFVKRAEKLGVNPTDILDNPPLPGQTLEGWLLKIDDPRNPVNLPSTLDLSDAKIRELWEGAINNPESDEYVIGYFGGDNVIPYNKLANDRNATFFSMEESVYRDTGFKKDTGDFWNVNREAIMYGVDERKTFVLNVKLDRVLSNPEKTTYAEVQLILHPGNNYVVIEGDEYDMLVPAELLNP